LSKKQEIISNLNTTARLSWFEGQNIVFENLKSSGKLNLIQSDTISNSIQKYHRFFEEVVKQENLYNSRIIIFNDRNNKYYNNTSFIEPILIDNISSMKSWEMNSNKVRLALYNQAKFLNKLIGQYITENK
jgi:hypothetical protein